MPEGNRSVQSINTADVIDENIGHLKAMLVAICGGDIEHFETMNQTLKDEYLSACADKLYKVDGAWRQYREEAR